ncbi:hypothetical protein Jolie1_050 [Mycobacterium phage Julie1]|uniref:DUF6378 domain-containing protein n=1 Tax=Mycobacterium phage Julie1 TaxID=1463812 RepID=W8EEQ1_9CAUD|nr:hypothetical protein CG90_gp50 [Mycobacterium phage Julie1]AHJ88550.1 hypothetical protein Jolie1_050 [Mycobacterium phage Julie1]
MTDIPKYGEVDETDAARRQKALQTTTCLCPGDPSASAAGWNPLCPQHGNEAHRHPWLRDAAQPEPGSECPDQNHVGHCQCHLGGPVLMGADVELYDCCRAPAGGDHDDDCPDYPADPPECPRQHPPGPGWVAAENHGVKLLGPSVPYIPTLGDLAQTMRDWNAAGVSAESLQYAASKVWPEVNLLTIDRDRERDRLLKEAGAAISGDRERDYGSARDGFARTGRLIAAILDLDEITAEQVALILAALKISRLAQNTGHRDSWLDLIGYAALGGDIAADTAKDAHNPFA